MADEKKRRRAAGRVYACGGVRRERVVVLPWRRTLSMCVANVRHRRGRALITFVCIAVVVAFFAATLAQQELVNELRRVGGVEVHAALERVHAGAPDGAAAARQAAQQRWLLGLSVLLCLTGITNTILMSVTERVREIGTLKCLGALDRFIVRLFLIENACVGVTASVAGAVCGLGVAVVQTGLMTAFSFLSGRMCMWAALYSGPRAVALGTVLTVVASIYPTLVAARMKPADAMRVDV
ncbi:MAG: FtsX-like permease family protein [bacterium]|nr:FtsX-like permease family protein [bacterium]